MKAHVLAVALAAAALTLGLAATPAIAEIAADAPHTGAEQTTRHMPRTATTEIVPPGLVDSDARILAVAVNPDGTLQGPHGALGLVSVSTAGNGAYQVIFRKRNLHRACFWTASPGTRGVDAPAAGMVTAVQRFARADGLWVVTYGLGDMIVNNAPFMLIGICRN